MATTKLNLTLEFSGGAELLFDKIKSRNVILDSKEVSSIKDLLQWMKNNILRERQELFLQNDSVRPGILVLVNDVDWELMGALDYKLQENDCVLFISTLHGG